MKKFLRNLKNFIELSRLNDAQLTKIINLLNSVMSVVTESESDSKNVPKEPKPKIAVNKKNFLFKAVFII